MALCTFVPSMGTFRQVLIRIFLIPIRIYQAVISPLFPSSCRHIPTCSAYTVEAIQEWGILKGTWMGMKRLSKCHPWGTSGYDPVPKKHNCADHEH